MSKFKETEPREFTEAEIHVSKGEHYRALFDFIKHITTLDAGAIVLTVTLLEKVFPHRASRGLVALAIALFLLSLFAAAWSYFITVVHYPRVGGPMMNSADKSAS